MGTVMVGSIPRSPKRRRPRTRTITHNPRPRNAFYELRVFYDGGLDQHIDHLLFKAVGSQSCGSGCMLMGQYTRDHEWEFVKESAARAAARRVLKSAQSFIKHEIKRKIRVEIWDTKPRRILVDGGPK